MKNKLNSNKLKHVSAVADYMYEHAEGDEAYKQDMYTLGLLHDIGYITGESKGHGKAGGRILKRQDYEYWQEVYYHGSSDSIYTSIELDLLNQADLQINSKGEFVGYLGRLADIKARYGEESSQYKEAVKLASKFM